MRFPHLPIGARFEYQGKVYSKTGALLASAEDGSGQRMIPKFAEVISLDGNLSNDLAPSHPAKVDLIAVMAAFDAHHATCQTLLARIAAEPDQAHAAHAALESARLRFQAELARMDASAPIPPTSKP